MPFYRKLTEYCAKKIFNPDFPIIEINRDTPKSIISTFIKIHSDVIIKVDEFVKRRGKNGLVKKTNDIDKIIAFMEENQKYSHFILEKTFNIIEEKYFCIQYHNNKKRYIFNENGGINCDDPYKNATITDSIKDYENNFNKHYEKYRLQYYRDIIKKYCNKKVYVEKINYLVDLLE